MKLGLWRKFRLEKKPVIRMANQVGNTLIGVATAVTYGGIVEEMLIRLFAAGHLPATVSLFQGLDPLIILRCFVLNGLPDFCFGLLYQKYGLQYAIFCHMACHLWFKFMLMLII